MKRFLVGILFLFFTAGYINAQDCGSDRYLQQELIKDPRLAIRISEIEKQIGQAGFHSRDINAVIRIPVVVHVLYHYPSQKISDALVNSQIEALNRDFRRRATDTSKTPSYFKPFAADCGIEFYLATSDPQKRVTTGIVRKYSPIVQWTMDDKMKFSAEMGDDAWDARSYLNIWVCDLKGLAGYSSVPGGALEKDGLVIDFEAFGINNTTGYNMGRTVVHEAGHWLGLKHIWGDANGCGDDGVHDTPKQSFYTVGCPTGIRVTCDNGPFGNMYMNYMDFTEDGCMNLFTTGQKERMRGLFAPAGYRNSLLSSTGLDQPLVHAIPSPEADPKWLHPKIFPNPATNEMAIDLSYDIRWIGKTINITNLNGQSLMKVQIKNKVQQIELGKLKPGVYFLHAVKEDGATIKEKIIKL